MRQRSSPRSACTCMAAQHVQNKSISITDMQAALAARLSAPKGFAIYDSLTDRLSSENHSGSIDSGPVQPLKAVSDP
jgi:hypothetical protein